MLLPMFSPNGVGTRVLGRGIVDRLAGLRTSLEATGLNDLVGLGDLKPS